MNRIVAFVLVLFTSTLAVAETVPSTSARPQEPQTQLNVRQAPPVLGARDTAFLPEKGSWTIGVFNPLRYSVRDHVELEVHPLLFLVAPNATVRVAHLKREKLRLTGEYALSVPTLGMRLTKGYLFPSWGTSNSNIGWSVVASAGALLSFGLPTSDVWTVRADVAGGLPIGPNAATPLESSIAPLDLLFAPTLTRVRGHLGVTYDRAMVEVSPKLRLRASLDGYVRGPYPDGHPAPSPFVASAYLGADYAVGKASRFTLGVAWYNFDNHRKDLVKGPDGYAQLEPRRSNNFLPTIDFIWGG